MNDTDKIPLDVSIFVTEEDDAVYIKLSGFLDEESKHDYADFLVDYLPLMLFESKVLH